MAKQFESLEFGFKWRGERVGIGEVRLFRSEGIKLSLTFVGI